MKTIAVYCSSSDVIHQDYFKAATQLGHQMASKGFDLVYGGGSVGLMGQVARSLKSHNGKTIGVVPKALNIENVVNDIDDELIITDGMRERKAIMDERAGAFIGLPGGFGTLEEMFEVLTLKQLGYHNKPIVFLNIRGYYNKLIEMFEHVYEEQFAKEQYLATFDDPSLVKVGKAIVRQSDESDYLRKSYGGEVIFKNSDGSIAGKRLFFSRIRASDFKWSTSTFDE